MQYFLPTTDFISKIDTLDGKTLFIVCHFEKHPLDSKNQFSLGDLLNFIYILSKQLSPFNKLGNLMCLIESEKKNSLYEAECFIIILRKF